MIEERYRKLLGVYLIRLGDTATVYVGSTAKRFDRRIYTHLYNLRRGKHTNKYLQYAFNKYGEFSMQVVVLEVLSDPSQVLEREQYWLDHYRSIGKLYNVMPNAGTTLGHVQPESQKQKLREKLTGRKVPEDQRMRSINAARLHWEHPENRERASRRLKGAKRTDKTKQAMSNRMQGNKLAKRRMRQGFISPAGTVYSNIPDLSDFCREHGLIYDGMDHLDKEQLLSYKGWRKLNPVRQPVARKRKSEA